LQWWFCCYLLREFVVFYFIFDFVIASSLLIYVRHTPVDGS